MKTSLMFRSLASRLKVEVCSGVSTGSRLWKESRVAGAKARVIFGACVDRETGNSLDRADG